jgi:hypothetical protein
LCEEYDKLNLRIVSNIEAMEMEVGSSLLQEIRKGQVEDEKIQEIKCNIKEEKSPSFSEDEEGVLWYMERICMSNAKKLKDKILCEPHEPTYSIHLGSQGHLLVVRNVLRRCRVCCALRHLSVSQG